MDIVICTDNHGVRLTEQHLEWLHQNGYPDAEYNFCNADRSNPALIACIEAVRMEMEPLVAYAENLRLKLAELEKAAAADIAIRAAALGDMNRALRNAGCPERLDWYINSEIIGQLDNGARWHDANQWFQSRWAGCRPNDEAQSCYEHLLTVWKTPAIEAYSEAYAELERYCEENSIIPVDGGAAFAINDGFAILEYDENRFQAKIKEIYEESTAPCADDLYESLELIPFVSRKMVEDYVRAGNTDALMTYIQSLGMEVRD